MSGLVPLTKIQSGNLRVFRLIEHLLIKHQVKMPIVSSWME